MDKRSEKSEKISLQQEDATLKISMNFFADELLPYFGIEGRVIAIAPTESVHLQVKKLFQDFNLVMEDGTWKHFEFQSTNEGILGLKRFRVYESLASYQNKVSITTYVLYSGRIKKPVTEFTEGVNTYRIVPIIMQDKNADQLIRQLECKVENGEALTKEDLVPLTLCPLMDGEMSQKDRVKAACKIVGKADAVAKEDIEKIGTVIFAMASKFLEEMEREGLLEEFYKMDLGQMIMNKGREETKLENARNLLDLLDEHVIAERIGLPLETVKRLKEESAEG